MNSNDMKWAVIIIAITVALTILCATVVVQHQTTEREKIKYGQHETIKQIE